MASYSEGIYQKTLNQELNAQLHLNRAAAQYHLDNFNAALDDCILALKFKPNYVKAMLRLVIFFLQHNMRKLIQSYNNCLEPYKTHFMKSVQIAKQGHCGCC